ncbi:MAG: GNAT family N-acetyltransferase [Rhodospirillales bacterium]|nr:GNAT family N-acetyltransferase [Rhodospirillales bacterium]MCW8861877.1 GNAT family N-acetyltransferase [Rhodospirillales bacterium]MCW8951942.1 GNAT family N-acetyltransferase [Rhodospirillales bacterium]MCW9001244.1 GNAT family N-acetyltransferase [Rhodospirillales bacterium]MCW9039651.1 GNAT family N-acetyltransferase [Rhodospirillales bacterium]
MPDNGAQSQNGASGDSIAPVVVRPARLEDVPAVIAIDARNTGMEKPDYWQETFDRFGRRSGRYFLVAEDPQADGAVFGFITGEIRAWEFGSPPCGWVFALGVDPDARLRGVGSRLFCEICDAFSKAGMDKVRTMLARDDRLNMAFFRSQGMMGGPFIQLEKPLTEGKCP